MKKSLPSLLASCLIGFLMIVMLIIPTICIEGAKSGLMLWFNKLLPSLLPFMILLNFLCLLGIFFKISNKLSFFTTKVFHLSGTTFMLFLLGLIGGYPMGAKLAKQLLDSHQITFEEAEKTLCFGTNCGPLFIIGTVGTIMLGNTQLGYFLLVVHLVSAFIMLILSRFYQPTRHSHIVHRTQQSTTPTLSEALTKSVQNGMDTIVYVGGYIILFSMLIAILNTSRLFEVFTRIMARLFHIPADTMYTILLGSLEFSNGSALATSFTPMTLSHLALLSGLIAFGGFCVLFQCSYVLQGSGLPLKTYFFSKLLQGCIAYALTFILAPFFKVVSPLQTASSIHYFILLAIIILIAALLFRYLPSKKAGATAHESY